MVDFNIPNLNNSDKYIFKKKSNFKRKSNKRLLIESILMFFLSILIVYLNYLIPNKVSLLQNLPFILNKSFLLIIDILSILYDVFLLSFIFISWFIVLFLLIGSVYRLFRVTKRNYKKTIYK